MATLVEIAALSAKVACTPDGHATHVFTLRNPSPSVLTVDLRLEAESAVASPWFTLAGAPRRALAARGADRVIVHTRLPAGTAAGSHGFRLVVCDTQGERLGTSPRAAVQATTPLAGPARAGAAGPGGPARPGRWLRHPAVWLRWVRRCFVMPAFGPAALAQPAGGETPAWLVKGLLGLGGVLFVVALGANLVSAANPQTVLKADPTGSGRQVPVDTAPPPHWITSLAGHVAGCGTKDTEAAQVRLFSCADTTPKHTAPP